VSLQRHQQAPLQASRATEFWRHVENPKVVAPWVSNARWDVRGECVVVVEEIQAGTRWVWCLPLQEEIGISIPPSSCEVVIERGESRDQCVLRSVWWSWSPSSSSSLFSLPFSFSLLNDKIASKTLTPPDYIYKGRSDSAPIVLTMDTTTNTHVSNDPFLIDWDDVADFRFNIINVWRQDISR
jgi:hypothetical protein